jgi:2-polyprenyl-6-methoxyphenol hydroxylase-like FAD-dependent oxidoreductase
MLAILPLSEDELAIQCYVHNSENVDNAEAIRNGILSDSFKDFNSDVIDLVKRLEEKGGLFSDKLGIVHEPVLHKGRVVLLGDAGYCPTGLSGMGASLSIYGAKALVHFIGRSPNDLNKALTDFNSLMQPIILKFQRNARKNAKTFLPMSAVKLSIKNIVLKYIPNSFITRKINKELKLTGKMSDV